MSVSMAAEDYWQVLMQAGEVIGHDAPFEDPGPQHEPVDAPVKADLLGEVEPEVYQDRFTPRTFAQMLDRAAERPVFVIEGLVCRTFTAFYARPKVGKSWLAVQLIHAVLTGGSFLGRTIGVNFRRVVLLTTDADGCEEYAGRMRETGLTADGTGDRLEQYGITGMSPQDWREVVQRARPGSDTLVILDNLSQVPQDGTSFADGDAINTVFRGLRGFTDAGSPVVVVAHEKDGRITYGDRIEAHLRWFVRLHRAPGQSLSGLTLTTRGNAGPGEVIRVDRSALPWRPKASVSEQEVQAKRQQRNAVQAQEFRAMAEWAVANHPTVTAAVLGRLLAARYSELAPRIKQKVGQSDEDYLKERGRRVEKDISERRNVGGFLCKSEGRWVCEQPKA